jgi:hypothetical protein
MKKEPRKQKKKAGPDATMLQTVPKKRNGGQNAIPSTSRRLFLHFFEQSCGNVSYACAHSGIARCTYYRWMKSTSRINKKFQRMIKDIEPEERRLDVFEGALVSAAARGEVAAIIYGLKTKGRGRGYIEAKDERKPEELDPSIVQLRMGIERRAAENGVSFEEQLRHFLESPFADQVRPDIKHQLASELVH